MLINVGRYFELTGDKMPVGNLMPVGKGTLVHTL